MKLDFISVTINGFRSFKETSKIPLKSNSNALVLVRGLNTVDSALESNGAGKSSVFEALFWCFFGKTSTNLKGPVIISRGLTTGTFVEVEFSLNNTKYLLKRTQSPNSISLNGKTVTDDYIENFLGMEAITFQYLFFSSQFSDKFFDLEPAERLALMSSILSTQTKVWDECQDICKKMTSSIENSLKSEQRLLDTTLGKIAGLEEMDFEEQEKQFAIKRSEEVDFLHEQEQELSNKILNISNEIDSCSIYLYSLENKPDNSTIEAIRDKLVQAQNAYERAISNDSIASANLVKINQKIFDIENTPEETICPTCKQTVKVEGLGKMLEALIEEKEELVKIYKETSKEVASLKTNNAHIALKKELKEIEEVEYAKAKKFAELDKKVAILYIEKDKLSMQLSKIPETIEKIVNEENPFVAKRLEKEQKIKEYKKQVEECKNKVTEFEYDFTMFTFWTKEFKSVKMYSISKALKDFENYINYNIDILGLKNYKVTIQPEIESKSGGQLIKGFLVLVSSPDGETVPFKSFSGGEASRIRLAGTLGLMDFITAHTGIRSSMEVFDEPTAWLSTTGIQDLLEALKQRVLAQEKTIFLIDHKDFESNGIFDKTIKIVKDDKGSHYNDTN